MADQPSTVRVTDNPALRRYEAHHGDTLAAFATYALTPGRITFLHTETEPGFEGQGVASHLAEAALADVKARGLHVAPVCPFFASYIARHPDSADLVDSPR